MKKRFNDRMNKGIDISQSLFTFSSWQERERPAMAKRREGEREREKERESKKCGGL